MSYLKPQTPLQHKDGDYFYPLTTIDQVIMEDGITRLNGADLVSVNTDGAPEGETVKVNADTLNGISADKYATVDDLNGKLSTDKIVNNFTTTEEGFVADARALKVLNDGICNSIAFFSVGRSNDGQYYYCTIKNLRTSDVSGRTPFVVLISHQNQNPILATVMLSSKGNFKTSSERITYADGTLTIDCGYSAYASPLIIYPRNYFEFS